MLCDSHCHFFSQRFLELLTRDVEGLPAEGRAAAVAGRLKWDPPADPAALADRWVAELDRYDVGRATLIASVPGDEDSVRTAVARHRERFVGAFMFNPAAPGALDRLHGLLDDRTLRVIALFPAMHRYRLDDAGVGRVFEAAAASGAVVFVHCGVLTVGVRKALGLPSPFDLRLGDPLAVAAVACRYPQVPVILPHFGAGFFREALMAADQCANIRLDTSSSNGWIKYHPGLTLDEVMRQAIAVAGADRLLFGTDSSYFPRGWNAAVYDNQRAALERIGASTDAQALIFGGNYNRLFA